MVKNVSSISREFSKLINENEETVCTNLILDFHVRWNSTYLMLKRLLRSIKNMHIILQLSLNVIMILAYIGRKIAKKCLY